MKRPEPKFKLNQLVNYLGDWIPVYKMEVRDHDGRIFLELDGIWVDQDDVRGLTKQEMGL